MLCLCLVLLTTNFDRYLRSLIRFDPTITAKFSIYLDLNPIQLCNRRMNKENNQTYLLSALGLSLATSPFILTILILQFLGELLKNFGEASEEIFRAEQLPLLNITDLEKVKQLENLDN